MIREQTLHDLQKTMKFLYHEVLCPWICSSVSWFIVCGNLNRICILLLCENCINLNYIEKNNKKLKKERIKQTNKKLMLIGALAVSLCLQRKMKPNV